MAKKLFKALLVLVLACAAMKALSTVLSQNFSFTESSLTERGIYASYRHMGVFTTKGKLFKTHWLAGDKKTVACPGPATCEHCICDRAKSKAILPVIERKTNDVKIWEVGPQLMLELYALSTMFKDDGKGETMTDYNLVIQRGRPGENPLYRLRQADKVTGTAQDAQDQALIAANPLDLEQFVRKANQDTLGSSEG